MKRLREHALFWPASTLLLLLAASALFNPAFLSITWQDGHLYGSVIDILNRAAPLIISYAARPRAAAIYSIAGQRVRDLADALGEGSAEWDLRNDRGAAVASGAYYLVLQFPEERVVRKLFVVRP